MSACATLRAQGELDARQSLLWSRDRRDGGDRCQSLRRGRTPARRQRPMTLEAEFWARLLGIVVIDLTLAGDNALVIAMAVRSLPRRQQTVGRLWGTAGRCAPGGRSSGGG